MVEDVYNRAGRDYECSAPSAWLGKSMIRFHKPLSLQTMSTAEELFPTIGQVANQTDQIKPNKTQVADDEEKAVTEISSLCMECHEQVRYFKLKCTAFI